MKKIPFNHKIALENPKAVVKTKNGHVVTGLRYRDDVEINSTPYKLVGEVYFNGEQDWTLAGCYLSDCSHSYFNLELYVPFTSFWDRIKYYLKIS